MYIMWCLKFANEFLTGSIVVAKFMLSKTNQNNPLTKLSFMQQLANACISNSNII